MGILSLYSVPHVKPLAVTVLRCDNIVQLLPLAMKKASHNINLTHFLFLNLLQYRQQQLFNEDIAQLRIL